MADITYAVVSSVSCPVPMAATVASLQTYAGGQACFFMLTDVGKDLPIAYANEMVDECSKTMDPVSYAFFPRDCSGDVLFSALIQSVATDLVCLTASGVVITDVLQQALLEAATPNVDVVRVEKDSLTDPHILFFRKALFSGIDWKTFKIEASSVLEYLNTEFAKEGVVSSTLNVEVPFKF